MNKQFILSIVVVFVVAMVLGYVVHEILLKSEYAQLTTVMRTAEDAAGHMWAMLLAHGMIAVGITGLYRGGRDATKPWLGQGVRFGLWWAVGAALPLFLIYHAVAQFPLSLALKQCAFEGLSAIVLGIAAAAVNKAPSPAAA